LGFHDELLSHLASPDIEGHVVLGTPDLYAAFMLPSILKIFRKAFPRVQLELNSSLSTPLVGCVKRGEVDIALVTRMNDFTGGQVVRQEQLIWMTGEQSTAHNERLPTPCTTIWLTILISTTNCCWARSCPCPRTMPRRNHQDIRGRN